MWNYTFLIPYIPLLVQSTLITIALSITSLVIGTVLGFLISLCRLLNAETTNKIFGFLVGFIRGTPVLVQLLAWYLIPQSLGYPLSPFVAVIIGLGVNSAAFISEIVRGAIQAIPSGQREAALSIGLSKTFSIIRIEFPQALPVILPAMMGFFISLIKDTSFAYVVGYFELTRTGKIIADREFKPMQVYLIIAFIYFALCFPLSKVVRIIDKKLQEKGFVRKRLTV